MNLLTNSRLFVTLLFSALVWGAYGDQFEDVVTTALENYPDWLKNNALDPYVNPDFNAFQSTIGLTIRYALAFGPMEVSGTSNLDQSQTNVQGNLASRTLRISYTLNSDVVYTGLYHINGTALLTPFEGTGKWTAASKPGSKVQVNMVATDFTAGDDCRVVLNKFDDRNSNIILDAVMDFENLEAGLVEDLVKKELYDGAVSVALTSMVDLMTDYLRQVFENTAICN